MILINLHKATNLTHNKFDNLRLVVIIILLFVISNKVSLAQDIDKNNYEYLRHYTLNPEHTNKLARMPIQLKNGRISSFEVFSNRLLLHITNAENLEKYNSTDVVMGFILYPEIWERVPLIHQNSRQLANLLGTGDKHLSYRSLFDGRGKYILDSYVHLAMSTPEKERTNLDRQILQLHEKIKIISQLKQARLLPMFPLSGNNESRWHSPGERFTTNDDATKIYDIERIFVSYLSHITEAKRSGDWEPANNYLDSIYTYQTKHAAPFVINKVKLNTENLYIKYDWNIIIAYGYLITGSLLLILYFMHLFIRSYKVPDIKRYLYFILYPIFGVQTLTIMIQGYVYEGRFWMSHMVLTSLFAWITATVGFTLKKKSNIGLFICIIISGILASQIDNRPYYLDEYKYMIFQESVTVRIYYTSILCSISLLITSSLISLILMLITGLRKYIGNSTTKLKELIKLGNLLSKLGLSIFIVSAIIRIYLSIDLSHAQSWLLKSEYIWIGTTFITYAIVYALNRIKRPNLFLIKQSASVMALVVMIFFLYNSFYL